MSKSLSPYLRYVNYLSAAQLYLRDNFLLREELKPEHIKDRILGHWGTVPGQNFVYAHANRLIAEKGGDRSWLFVSGPGHGAPAVLANLFAEGTLEKYYPELTRDNEGTGKFIKMFSWPGGFPSHCNPGTPGTILEGGELGYSLSTSFGAVFDNPDLITVCVVGDGEAETGPMATAWHSTKFLDPATSGAVLPVLHVNGYKITGPTIFGTMSDDEIREYFHGLHWEPIFVETSGHEPMDVDHEAMASAMDRAFSRITDIQKEWRKDPSGLRPPSLGKGRTVMPRWPLIVLRSPKGWTGIRQFAGKKVEGTQRSHGIPLMDPKNNPEEFAALRSWLESYRVAELVDADGKPLLEILDTLPPEKKRMGVCPHAFGGNLRKELSLPLPTAPRPQPLAHSPQPIASSTKAMSDYLADVIRANPETFRFFCPDETESNKLSSLFRATDRAFLPAVHDYDEHNSPQGRVMEMLSEHTLQGWLQGYLLTGRHGLFATYEAFAMITASMVDQYAKFLKQSRKHAWRKPISSLNYLLTSVGWRQEHNGYSHQNPSFIANILEKHGNIASVYFPCDANAAQVILEDCLKRTDGINVIVANKAELPQYLTIEQAREELKTGIGRWDWIDPAGAEDPDVVFAAAGDIFVTESIEAIRLLKKYLPDAKTRFVNVSELTALGVGDERYPLSMDDSRFVHHFTADKRVVFAFHGYPATIRSLLWNHTNHARFSVHGYQEEGTTTTPFDMLVLNKASRYHLVLDALDSLPPSEGKDALTAHCNGMLAQHAIYIREHGKDMEEVS